MLIKQIIIIIIVRFVCVCVCVYVCASVSVSVCCPSSWPSSCVCLRDAAREIFAGPSSTRITPPSIFPQPDEAQIGILAFGQRRRILLFSLALLLVEKLVVELQSLSEPVELPNFESSAPVTQSKHSRWPSIGPSRIDARSVCQTRILLLLLPLSCARKPKLKRERERHSKEAELPLFPCCCSASR